ncbi:MAG: hypothetical protein WDM71_10440 [Ferruginibacter sp.]
MSLENIQLPPVVLQELFKTSLIQEDNTQPAIESSKKTGLTILGNNKKNICILIENNEAVYLPDEQLNFLVGILSACKLTLDDVAIINIKNKLLLYSTLVNELKAEKIFLFGVDPSKIELPLTFPYYQVQKYNEQEYLSSPSLVLLQNDKTEKTKLWFCLKQIFSI